jgi:CRP-like cAMP-binding protein
VRKASVIATSDCECFVLDRDTFVRILGSMQHIMNKETMSRLEALKTNSSKESSKDG